MSVAWTGSARSLRSAGVRIVVAIPVCNERERIAGCLQALNGQSTPLADSVGVVVFLNNCRDGTADVVAALASTLSFSLRVIERDDADASAGWARRRAMEAAAAWLDESDANDGVPLTTDADSRVPPDWIARNLAALDAGADLVAGRLALDPDDAAALPVALRARGILEAEYEALLTEISARLDPRPGDPWPNHASHSGASLAMRLRTYRRVGGMPDIPCGEDRAFVEAVMAHDGIVRHDPDIVVVTSGRLFGRAKGGVADTIRLRCEVPDSPCDDRLERVGRMVARTRLRRHLRRLHAAGRKVGIGDVVLEFGAAKIPGALPSFGVLHATLERTSPRLVYLPVRPSGLPNEIERARMFLRLLGRLRGRAPRLAILNRDRIAAGACD